MRRVFVEGMRYGLEHPVVRPVMLASLVSMSFMIFGFYSWQRYFLDLLGKNLVWVDGVISSLVGLSLIAGNALVAPVSRVVRTRTGVLKVSVAVQAASVVLCGLLTDFYVVVALYLVYGLWVASPPQVPASGPQVSAVGSGVARVAAHIAAIGPEVTPILSRLLHVTALHVLPDLPAVLADVLHVALDVPAVAAQLTPVVANLAAVVAHVLGIGRLGGEHQGQGER